MLRVWTYAIMVMTILLTVFGIVVIAYAAKSQSSEVMRFSVMQSMYFGIALVGATVLYFVDYHFYRKPQIFWTIAGLMLFSLLLVIIPGVGKEVKGSLRWIALGPLSVQPVEFVKLMAVLFLSAYYEHIGGRVVRFVDGIVIPGSVLVLVALLLVCQPDYGGIAIVGCFSGVTMLLAGIGWKRVLPIAFLAVIALLGVVAMNENRVRRLMKDIPAIESVVKLYKPEWTQPVTTTADGTVKANAKNENYQAEHSKTAFKNGGLLGVGLGKGMQKENYLPDCHTDFIFAVVAEDFGFVATASIWVAYIIILIGGSTIAFCARDKQGMLLAFGATLLLCVQGVANMAVATHIFPTKGLALPFLSYGGSCLLSSFATVGVILSVGRKTIDAEYEDEAVPTKRVVSFD